MHTGTIAVVGGAVLLGVVAAVLIQNAKKNKDCERLLEECFGEPMAANTFTLGEARDWIAQRKERMGEDTKALISKMDQENLKKYGIDLPVKESAVMRHYLLLAIIDTKQGDILDSALVKYEHLDQSLETALEKGKGSMVVTL